jgi:ABC-type glycerol-3-phosphate transport system permease component
MTTVTRRNVLKSGTALVGGMAGILAAGRAPAFALVCGVFAGYALSRLNFPFAGSLGSRLEVDVRSDI